MTQATVLAWFDAHPCAWATCDVVARDLGEDLHGVMMSIQALGKGRVLRARDVRHAGTKRYWRLARPSDAVRWALEDVGNAYARTRRSELVDIQYRLMDIVMSEDRREESEAPMEVLG